MKEGEKGITLIEAEPEAIRIDVLKTAVLVVDMQNAFVLKGGYFDLIGIDISPTKEIIRPCKEIVRAAREEGAKIIYLQMGFSPDLSDTGPPDSPSAFKSKGLNLIMQRPEFRDKVYLYGTWGAEIIDELRPHQDDIVIKKQRYDGFVGTNLDIILRKLAIKYLVFIGTATNICIESTLRHSFFLDYFPIMITDATTQLGPSLVQDATILNIKSNFGWVTNSQKFLNALHNNDKALLENSHSRKG